MKFPIVLALVVLAGCAASPEKVESVAQSESARLQAPTRPLSSFAAYELRPMVLSPAVQREKGKVEVAAALEAKLQQKLQPLMAEWSSAPAASRSGTLVIEPQLVSLKVVSGGARFWAGAMAGDSSIDMDLALTERETAQVIVKARVANSADAFAGGWSIGASDRNLLDYVAATAYQYLKDHY